MNKTIEAWNMYFYLVRVAFDHLAIKVYGEEKNMVLAKAFESDDIQKEMQHMSCENPVGIKLGTPKKLDVIYIFRRRLRSEQDCGKEIVLVGRSIELRRMTIINIEEFVLLQHANPSCVQGEEKIRIEWSLDRIFHKFAVDALVAQVSVLVFEKLSSQQKSTRIRILELIDVHKPTDWLWIY